MTESDTPLSNVRLTSSQRKTLLKQLHNHPIFRLAFTLEERMSGDYQMDRAQLMAGVYILRLALDPKSAPAGNRRPLVNLLERFEQQLGVDSSSAPEPKDP